MSQSPAETDTRKNHPRRAATLLAAALLIPPALAASLFSFDIGSIMLVRSQLQVAADSSALAAAAALGHPRADLEAVARENALCPQVDGGGQRLAIDSSDIEYGVWDTSIRKFTPCNTQSNAVRVTARAPQGKASAMPLIFPKLLGNAPFIGRASAVAEVAPREICFVVDLSGSSNDDTEPCWATDAIIAKCSASGDAAQCTRWMQQVYDDFSFGSHPGELHRIGEPWGIDPQADPLMELAKPDGPLANESTEPRHRILPEDDEPTRTAKACRAVIDAQIARWMPNAQPSPRDPANFAWWRCYLDYVAASPDNPGAARIDRFNNPDYRKWPASVRLDGNVRGMLGYKTYVQYLMDLGRDRQAAGRYSPLSRYSPDCPWHDEATVAGMFRFPPREQPMHGIRLALIAAMQQIKLHNTGIADEGLRDRVSVVTYDSLAGGGPQIVQSLSSDYDAAMQGCASLQAASDTADANATEAGLATAHEHLRTARSGAEKIVVLLTDGAPRLYVSEPVEIKKLAAESVCAAEFSQEGDYARDAVLMRIDQMRVGKYRIHAVGIGVAYDQAFLDAMARVAGTADGAGRGPRSDSGDCAAAAAQVIEQILTHPRVRLVN